MGSWNAIEDIAIADCALEIHGGDLDDLFATAARALADTMVDPGTLRRDVARSIELHAQDLELLLHDWLTELIVLKDSEQLVFPDAVVHVEATPPALSARLNGGRIDRARTALRADAKAVTFHRFAVEPRGTGWYARVIIDI